MKTSRQLLVSKIRDHTFRNSKEMLKTYFDKIKNNVFFSKNLIYAVQFFRSGISSGKGKDKNSKPDFQNKDKMTKIKGYKNLN